MGSLPFCWVTTQRVRCPHGPYFKAVTGYPEAPKTIGEMIRKRRLDLHLYQKDVAKLIGCDQMSIVNWEKNHTQPRISHMGEVVRFLGYNPLENKNTMAQRLVNHRRD
jgi:predicted transcriptional regulator